MDIKEGDLTKTVELSGNATVRLSVPRLTEENAGVERINDHAMQDLISAIASEVAYYSMQDDAGNVTVTFKKSYNPSYQENEQDGGIIAKIYVTFEAVTNPSIEQWDSSRITEYIIETKRNLKPICCAAVEQMSARLVEMTVAIAVVDAEVNYDSI